MPRFNPDDYIDVQERINRFWQEYPEGAIRTRLMSPPDDFDHCRYEASVYKHRDNERPDATGYAVEFAGGAGANQTSWEENGETSSIGRALANMGYATSRQDRPSKQEMTKVAKAGETATNAAPIDVETARMRRLHAVAKDRGLNHDELHAIVLGRGKQSLKDLSPQEMDTFTNWLEKVSPPSLQTAIDSGREHAG